MEEAYNETPTVSARATASGHVLWIIVLAQFAGTSVWFATNAVLVDITGVFHLPATALASLTSAVQFGFILGTFVFALLNISDRFSPSRVFFFCTLVAAVSNLAILWADAFTGLFILRCLTGVCLAGIYPVGMKIAADYHQKSLGKALGFLVGALVLGTAFPHLLKALTGFFNWKYVLFCTSALSLLAGLTILTRVPDGPYRAAGKKIDLKSIVTIFRKSDFRAAASGYFGHMWELYTFWAFVPIILTTYQSMHPLVDLNIPLTAFSIISAGTPGCILGAYLAGRIGSFRTAKYALTVSLACCLLSPVLFQLPWVLFLTFLLLWAMAVVADSPQFSTLVAHSALAETKGTALTIVNCIGFSITIISLQFISLIKSVTPNQYLYLFLAIGPVLGLLAMKKGRPAEPA